MQNVKDVMDRSTSRVPPHRYSVNFVPAVNKRNSDVNILLLEPSLTVVEGIRQKAHSLRTCQQEMS